jgi:hypothetical protein
MTPAATQDAALEPVRAAMLRNARNQAEQIVARAARAAEALLAQAHADVEVAMVQAQAEGAAAARSVAAAEIGRSRRAARSAILGAEQVTRDGLVTQIRAAIVGLRDEPGYPHVLDRLTELAKRAAGPDAIITEHPDGGVVARSAGVLVDCSLPRLADRAVIALAARISELCQP